MKLGQTLSFAHMHRYSYVQTHTFKLTHTLVVPQETWLGTETKNKLLLGSQGTTEVMVHERTTRHHRDYPENIEPAAVQVSLNSRLGIVL